MANEKRLRQSILRDAIRENVDVIEGRLPKGLRRTNRVRRTLFRTSVLIVVPLALFLSINALTTGRGERTDALVVSAPPAAPAAPATVINAPNGLEPSLFRLEVRSVVIDPGHGGTDPGAMASGVAEKDVTLDVARRLRDLLVAQKFVVSLTREADSTLSLKDRVVFANARKADLFVSIHVNSLPSVKDKRGVETYFLGTTTDPHVQQLAGDENRSSAVRRPHRHGDAGHPRGSLDRVERRRGASSRGSRVSSADRTGPFERNPRVRGGAEPSALQTELT